MLLAPQGLGSLVVRSRLGAAVLAVVLQRELAGGAAPSTAYAHTFWWSLAFTALAFVPALFLGRSGPVHVSA
ncbi:hypothetical protein [Actinomadura violacea]|uniref:Uncharacterized protein n=1 Tax=Actinomadura violacea TaxID=2819934 RepID=A0ABS3RX60_9ACTN|nr:hypothetical protein [Actinomadura violacea]MBO2460629.1 hypothetical protein [Actinomadura violacea]